MNDEIKMEAALKFYYEKSALHSIDRNLKENLYKVADKIVEEYLKKTDIKTAFIKAAKEEFHDDVVIIQLQARKEGGK